MKILDLLVILYSRLIWRPIHTAPRDGTVVDLWHKSGARIHEVWWCADEHCWSNLLTDSDITHWSPVVTPEGMLTLCKDEDNVE